MRHHTSIREKDEGAAQAYCSCGWESPIFGREKKTGTMDALQEAKDAADLHEWDASLE